MTQPRSLPERRHFDPQAGRALIASQSAGSTSRVEDTARTGDDTDPRRRRPADQAAIAVLTALPVLVLLQRLPVPILVLQDDAAIVFANHAFAEMLGHSQQSLGRLELRQIFPGVALNASVLNAFKGCAGRIVELAHADQSAVRARISKSALLRRDDPIALVMFDDLTENIWENPRIQQRSS